MMCLVGCTALRCFPSLVTLSLSQSTAMLLMACLITGGEERKKWIFGQHPTCLGSWVLTCYSLTFRHGRNHRLRLCLLTLSCAAMEGGMMWIKWICSSYPLQCVCSLIFFFFCPISVLELLCWAPRPPQRYTCLWVVVKVNALWGNDSRKLIFHHLAGDISPSKQHFLLIFSSLYFL